MDGYRYEVGQQVQVDGDGLGTVTYRCNVKNHATAYMVRPDGSDWEFLRGESLLSPAPLRRGDTVQREQADTIPVGTIVRSAGLQHYQRDFDGKWSGFRSAYLFSHDEFRWPVNVVDVPGGDNDR